MVTGNGGGVQQSTTVTLTVVAGTSGITLDGNVHGVQDNGTTYTSTASVTIGTPHAGDLITCEVTFDSINGNSLISVADPNNGTYAAAVPMHTNTPLRQAFGIYYMQNAAALPTTVTINTTVSHSWLAISCEAWKGAAASTYSTPALRSFRMLRGCQTQPPAQTICRP